MPNKHQSSAARTHSGPRWPWYCQSHPTATAPQHQCASDTRRALRHPTAGLTPKPNATVTMTPHIHHPTSTTANASTAAQRRHGHSVPSPSEVPGFGVTQRTSPPAYTVCKAPAQPTPNTPRGLTARTTGTPVLGTPQGPSGTHRVQLRQGRGALRTHRHGRVGRVPPQASRRCPLPLPTAMQQHRHRWRGGTASPVTG